MERKDVTNTIARTAERLTVHPYLVAIAYALLAAPTCTKEEELIRSAWLEACERYGLDLQTRRELLIDIAATSDPPVEPS